MAAGTCQGYAEKPGKKEGREKKGRKAQEDRRGRKRKEWQRLRERERRMQGKTCRKDTSRDRRRIWRLRAWG